VVKGTTGTHYPSLLDNGYVMAPHLRDLRSKRRVGGRKQGRPANVDFDLLAKVVAEGHDKELETGVQTVLEELKTDPITEIKVSAHANYDKTDGLGGK